MMEQFFALLFSLKFHSEKEFLAFWFYVYVGISKLFNGFFNG
jgi:hypothetical protein